MTIYNAPVEEMMFLFDHLKDNKNYNEIEKFKEINSELVKDILNQAAKLNQEIIHQLAKIGDENPCVYNFENSCINDLPSGCFCKTKSLVLKISKAYATILSSKG